MWLLLSNQCGQELRCDRLSADCKPDPGCLLQGQTPRSLAILLALQPCRAGRPTLWRKQMSLSYFCDLNPWETIIWIPQGLYPLLKSGLWWVNCLKWPHMYTQNWVSLPLRQLKTVKANHGSYCELLVRVHSASTLLGFLPGFAKPGPGLAVTFLHHIRE